MPNGVCLLLAAVSLEIIHCLLHNFEDQRVVVGSSNAGDNRFVRTPNGCSKLHNFEDQRVVVGSSNAGDNRFVHTPNGCSKCHIN